MTTFLKTEKKDYSASLSQPSIQVDFFRSFFENRKNSVGFYIDIGIHYPYPFFGTSHFNQKGWQRIMLEPVSGSSRLFDLFSKSAVCSDLIIGAKNIAVRKPTTTGTIVKTINIRKVPLSKILDDNLPVGQTIDFFSLDAEGLDPEALKSNNWNKYKPLCVIIKHGSDMNAEGAKTINYFLKKRNYEIAAKTEEALFYKLKR